MDLDRFLSFCAVLFSVACIPLAALVFSLLLVFLLGGSAGAGVPFLFSASSLGAKVAGTPLQAGACA